MPRLPITTEMLAAAYDYLQTTPPFCDWNLPDSEDVTFKVTRFHAKYGDWGYDGERHIIRISGKLVVTTNNLLQTLAHEMIHAHEHRNKCSTRSMHSAAFRQWANEVCEIHGWDPGLF